MKRYFHHWNDAEDFANEMVFGGDDANIVAELVEVWPDEDHYEEAAKDGTFGALYAIWGTEDELEAEMIKLGEYIDRKGAVVSGFGRTGRPDPEDQ